MKRILWIVAILTLFFMTYITACRKAGIFLVQKDIILHGDAIVILMGSISDRVLQAVDNYQNGYADKLIIVQGTNDGYQELRSRGAEMISGTSQAANAANAMGIPEDRIIILSGGAKSTIDEALIIKEYLVDKPEIDTLLLVSSSPHTRRAKMIFKNVFSKSDNRIHFICSPSTYTNFNAGKWWKTKDDIETVLLEYLKLMNYILFEKSNE